MTEKTLIHSRNITTKTYELRRNELLVEGVLEDVRLFPSQLYGARKTIDAGTVHRIVVRLSISLPETLITAAEAEMETVPSEICRQVRGIVTKLIGIRINRGFTKIVKEMIGGRKGCLHMTNLILAMASAAIQGQWAYYARMRDESLAQLPEADLTVVADSCWLWRTDGDYYNHIVRRMEKQEEV